MTILIGVDSDTKKLAATITYNGDRSMFMSTKKLPAGSPHQCEETVRWVRSLCAVVEHYTQQPGDVHVAPEKPFFSPRTARAGLVLAMVHGAILGEFGVFGAHVYPVEIATWKSRVVGNGSASKPDVAKWVHEFWPDAFNQANGDQDLIDSAAINRYLADIVGIRNILRNQPISKRPRIKRRRQS